MIVRLSDGCYVNRNDVQELVIKGTGYGDRIQVRMRDGEVRQIHPDYGKTAKQTLQRIQREINAPSTPTVGEKTP